MSKQASTCNGEQQHRELWPAYDANVAPPQASSEGLFQQTQGFFINEANRKSSTTVCDLLSVRPGFSQRIYVEELQLVSLRVILPVR
jgi:hypothetical protein